MKKFFKVLLLAAVALMPVMGMAQADKEHDYAWERQMRSQEYLDSVKAATKQAEYEHEEKMLDIKNEFRAHRFNLFWDEDLWALFLLAGGTLTIVTLCLRHSRRKAEDHKELINKLIDNNLLNSTEPISKEAIEALMKPKKSDKERYIFDATLLGIGLAASIISVVERLAEGFALISFILAGIGLLRIVTRATYSYFENKNAQKKTTDTAQEAEIVEEK